MKALRHEISLPFQTAQFSQLARFLLGEKVTGSRVLFSGPFGQEIVLFPGAVDWKREMFLEAGGKNRPVGNVRVPKSRSSCSLIQFLRRLIVSI